MTVKILNPLPGGRTRASFKQAMRYVKAGRGEFVKGCLRFHMEHPGHRAAEMQHTCGGYDRSARSGAVATDEQLAGVPIVKPRELTAPRGRFVPKPLFMRAADVNGTRNAATRF